MSKVIKKRIRIIVCVLVVIAFCFAIFQKKSTTQLYSVSENWAYLEKDAVNKQADVFFICPTVYGGNEKAMNMSLEDTETKKNFLGAINMEKGIYDKNCRFFAPYYRQAALNVYEMNSLDREKYLQIAYQDIKKAFEYYMENYNENRPIIIAGFSQGADLSIRLLKDYFSNEETNKLLIACYAIGWNISENELQEYKHLKFASSEVDTGVIVSFNSEAETVSDSLLIPKGTKTLAINPLNWKTDDSFANKNLNKGACFTDYSGAIIKEIPQLTGAYIDQKRGALKVVDVTSKEYPPVLSLFDEGVYHLYDYQFFYRNLQDNVDKRITAYLNTN